MSLRNRLLHILPNIRQMLIHRGYEPSTIIDLEPSPHLIYKIDQFISLSVEDNYKSFLDIFVRSSESRDFVRLLKNEKSIKAWVIDAGNAMSSFHKPVMPELVCYQNNFLNLLSVLSSEIKNIDSTRALTLELFA